MLWVASGSSNATALEIGISWLGFRQCTLLGFCTWALGEPTGKHQNQSKSLGVLLERLNFLKTLTFGCSKSLICSL